MFLRSAMPGSKLCRAGEPMWAFGLGPLKAESSHILSTVLTISNHPDLVYCMSFGSSPHVDMLMQALVLKTHSLSNSVSSRTLKLHTPVNCCAVLPLPAMPWLISKFYGFGGAIQIEFVISAGHLFSQDGAWCLTNGGPSDGHERVFLQLTNIDGARLGRIEHCYKKSSERFVETLWYIAKLEDN